MPVFDVGGIIWDLFCRKKRLNNCGGGGRWCQVLEAVLGALGVIVEIKAPVMAGAFGGIGLQNSLYIFTP